MTMHPPWQIARLCTYFRQRTPVSALEPAKAKPKPSRMDFFPNSITSFGIESKPVSTINFPTYLVTPLTSRKLSRCSGASPLDTLVTKGEPSIKIEALLKSRLSILLIGIQVVVIPAAPAPHSVGDSLVFHTGTSFLGACV